MAGPQVFHVPQKLAGETIVTALREFLPGTSWGNARKLLNSRCVTIHGAICRDAGRRLKVGDVLHIFEHSRTPQPTADDVEILYQDAQIVVVVKPALMTTLRHREERNWKSSRKNLQLTLEEALARKLSRRPVGRRRGTAKPPAIVFAVHRLDRDTSGVMVFARTVEAQRALIQQFKRHSTDRCYRAIVHGHPVKQTIENTLVRDRGDGLRGSSTTGEGQRAVTHITPIERLGDYSLIECRLETGRTHQIRIHLSELGYPVCGDPVYGKRGRGKRTDDGSGAPRLALHAMRLVLEHPQTGRHMEFTADLPGDLAAFVARLRAR